MRPKRFMGGWRNLAALGVCLFACTGMVGDLAGSLKMKGLGAISAAAPFPKVFCMYEGLEGFSSSFQILYTSQGEEHCIQLTPELYSRLKGPYNRRNVYGAALAGGPKLPQPLWESVFQFGFNGPLRQELKLPEDAANIRVVVTNKNQQWILQPGSKQ